MVLEMISGGRGVRPALAPAHSK